MTYALLDYSEIPLEIALSPERDRVEPPFHYERLSVKRSA